MSFISNGVEYALHCLLFLDIPAESKAGASVKDLAELQGVPVEYLAKLFTKLAKADLVAATEGVRGGYALSRPATEITFLDVVRAIDGHKALFECREIRQRCTLFDGAAPDWATHDVCSIHAVMLAAERRLHDELARHTLAEISSQVAAKAPADHQPKVIAWLSERLSRRRAGQQTAVPLGET